jgi:hypothetical protein
VFLLCGSAGLSDLRRRCLQFRSSRIQGSQPETLVELFAPGPVFSLGAPRDCGSWCPIHPIAARYLDPGDEIRLMGMVLGMNDR